MIFWILLFGFSVPSHGQSLFVGNAGEGVVRGKQIYLRDLFEANPHLNPVIGDAVDPEIVRRMEERFSLNPDGPLRTLRLDGGLLARKLSDLNRRHPNLGFYVLDAFSFHRWRRTEAGEGTVQFMDGHLILARRAFGLVSVEAEAWDRLSPSHRIALLVHEMLASFQKLDCVPDGANPPLCEKNDGILRSLVGKLFGPADEGSGSLGKELETHLAIPENAPTTSVSARPERIFERIERLCRRVPQHFTLVMERSPYLIHKEKYRRYYRHVLYYQDVTFRFEASVPSRVLRITPSWFHDDPT
ncbi:MAG TPA: hypothetical protein PL182_10960, partial [Pseudobdellovibrionaceae bacterium]|nr:hypothetical protein [Pseudobdellovibrionaceae bacterium]